MKLFSELTGKEKTIEVLRWFCVTPAAVLASLAPRLTAGLLMSPAVAQPIGMPRLPDSDYSRFLLRLIFDLIMGAGFVIGGAKMAPRYRLATAIVLAVVWGVYSLLIHVLVHLGRGTPHYMHFAVAAVAAGVGAAYIFKSENSKRSQ